VTAARDMNALRARSRFNENELPRINLGKAFDENLLGSQLRLRGRTPNAINT
jgi:hypothetical protein